MGYSIDLRDISVTKTDEDGHEYHPIVEVLSHTEGSNYAIDGSELANITITYNYVDFFDFRQLHEMKAKDSISILQKAVDKLGTKQDNDYWARTPGNAGHVCSVLLTWAKLHLEAIWDVR